MSAEAIHQEVFTTFDHTTTGLKLDIFRELNDDEAFASALQKALQSEDSMFVKRITYRFKEFIN